MLGTSNGTTWIDNKFSAIGELGELSGLNSQGFNLEILWDTTIYPPVVPTMALENHHFQ